VLDELERAGVIVDRIAGTSAGAVVGGLYAMGRTAAEVDAVLYEEFVRHNPLGDYTVPRHGLIRGERTVAGIRRNIGDVIFEELPREFYAVSVDLIHRRPVIHARGSVADAVSVSLRIPGLFPPMRLGDAVHVDGAVLDNLPVSALERVPDGPIIAVNIAMGGGSGGSGTSGSPTRPLRIPGIAETLTRTMFMSSGPATAAALARADVVVTPKTGDVGLLEWHQIDVLREAGRQAAIEAMPAILTVVKAGGAARLESPPVPSPVRH
jgi:NTE family protein